MIPAIFITVLILAIAAWFYNRKQSSVGKMIDVSDLDFARNVAKRLDEHRELVESIEQNTTLLKTHEWHINHLATQDDYLMWLFFLRHGAWPLSGNFIGNFRVDMVVRPRPEILGKCLHPNYTNYIGKQ